MTVSRLIPLLLAGVLCVAACGARDEAVPAAPELDPERVQALTEQLRADTATKRRAAAREAVADPRLAAALALHLGTALSDESHWVRNEAAKALVEAGPAAAVAMDALIRALSDPEDFVRGRAAMTLAGLGPAARPALETLERNANADDETEFGRHWAQVAVKRIRGE